MRPTPVRGSRSGSPERLYAQGHECGPYQQMWPTFVALCGETSDHSSIQATTRQSERDSSRAAVSRAIASSSLVGTTAIVMPALSGEITRASLERTPFKS
jgi:hypothetical protein